MKTFYKLLVGAALLSTTQSCKKELDRDPIGIITEEAPVTKTSLVLAVRNSYQLLSNMLNVIGDWNWGGGTVLRNDFIVQDIASGDLQKKWSPDGDQAWMDQFSDFSFTSSNAGINGQWTYDFTGIARTNLAIHSLTDDALMTQLGIQSDSAKYMLGQMYFLRAMYYFDLVNLYGDVPLVTIKIEKFLDAYDLAKRIPKAEIYAQISKDLADAKGLIPAGKYSSATEKWRVSKGAVLALQAKVALYNQQWADVISIINELDGLGYYSLDANYFDNFSVAKEFAENEVIFAYDHQPLTTPRTGNGICALLGWGFIAPTTNFINAFEANDPRLSLTVNTGEQAVYKLLGTLDNTYKGNDDAPSNKIHIRYADVLLWKAEALNETGSYAAAIGIINQVRQRARTSPNASGVMPPAGTLPARSTTVTDKAQIASWLMQERRVELGLESQRFNDLKRWGKAKEVLTAMGKNFRDINYLYPIPQGEIDKSGGSITQNPGY